MIVRHPYLSTFLFVITWYVIWKVMFYPKFRRLLVLLWKTSFAARRTYLGMKDCGEVFSMAAFVSRYESELRKIGIEITIPR